MSGIQPGVVLERFLAITAALLFLFRQEALLEKQYQMTAEQILREPLLTGEREEGYAGF